MHRYSWQPHSRQSKGSKDAAPPATPATLKQALWSSDALRLSDMIWASHSADLAPNRPPFSLGKAAACKQLRSCIRALRCIPADEDAALGKAFVIRPHPKSRIASLAGPFRHPRLSLIETDSSTVLPIELQAWEALMATPIIDWNLLDDNARHHALSETFWQMTTFGFSYEDAQAGRLAQLRALERGLPLRDTRQNTRTKRFRRPWGKRKRHEQ